MPAISAGILLYRRSDAGLELFLIHPGGPFFVNKDKGSWSIPKGEIEEGEDALAAAQREFGEETGCSVQGNFLPLTPIRQRGGKQVFAWAVEGNCDAGSIKSNTFPLEWPPGSGRVHDFPEADRAGWFSPEETLEKINSAQELLVRQLVNALGLS